MTILIKTVTRAKAWISQDSAAYVPNGEVWGHVQKLSSVPGRFIWGFATSDFFDHMAISLETMQSSDADNLAERLPAAFQRWKSNPVTQALCDRSLIVIWAGWSARQQRIVGYSARNVRSMVPTLLLTGHISMPGVNAKFPGFDGLQELSDAAENGEGVPEFHAAVARHMMEVAKGGGYGIKGQLGGVLQTATIDRDGVTIRDNCDLDQRLANARGEAAA